MNIILPEPAPKPDYTGLWILIIIGVVVVIVILVSRRRKNNRLMRIEELKYSKPVVMGSKYCRECETEILDETKLFCPNCGTKQIN